MRGSESWLVVRRRGSLWAVPAWSVRGVSPTTGAVSIRVVGGCLHADEVVDLATGLTVHPAGPVARRFLPRGSCGLVLGAGQPAIVVDPIDPPVELRAMEEEPG